MLPYKWLALKRKQACKGLMHHWYTWKRNKLNHCLHGIWCTMFIEHCSLGAPQLIHFSENRSSVQTKACSAVMRIQIGQRKARLCSTSHLKQRAADRQSLKLCCASPQKQHCLSALQYKIRWWTRRLLLLRAFSLVPALWTVAASHIL